MAAESPTPPAGMRWREYKGVTYRVHASYPWRIRDRAFEYVSDLVSTLRHEFDDNDLIPMLELMAKPYEPIPPEPVVRDATWKAVHRIIADYAMASAFKRWENSDATTDSIMRLLLQRVMQSFTGERVA